MALTRAEQEALRRNPFLSQFQEDPVDEAAEDRGRARIDRIINSRPVRDAAAERRGRERVRRIVRDHGQVVGPINPAGIHGDAPVPIPANPWADPGYHARVVAYTQDPENQASWGRAPFGSRPVTPQILRQVLSGEKPTTRADADMVVIGRGPARVAVPADTALGRAFRERAQYGGTDLTDIELSDFISNYAATHRANVEPHLLRLMARRYKARGGTRMFGDLTE